MFQGNDPKVSLDFGERAAMAADLAKLRRERNTARADADRLAGALRDALDKHTAPDGPETDCATTDAWQPIATAPKDGAEILGWRLDAGVMLIRWDAPEHFLSDGECEAMGGNAEKFDWMFADFGCGDRLEGDEVPTLWQPLPTDPSPRSRTNQGRPALQPGR